MRNFLVAQLPDLPCRRSRHILIDANDGTGDRLVLAYDEPRKKAEKPTVLLLHGLGGCQESCHMLLASAFFLERGHPVLRLNHRGAGPSRRLCSEHYHAGRFADIGAVVGGLPQPLRRHGVVALGFSLGGSLLLNYLAEHGDASVIQRAATVSAPIDLADCAVALSRWRNRLYNRYIMVAIKRHAADHRTNLSADERQAVLAAKTVLDLDSMYSAPRHGYRDVWHYYESNAPKRRLTGIRTPTLVIQAQDDPFVPIGSFGEFDWRGNPALGPVVTRSGGHLGFHDPLGIWYLRRVAQFFDLEAHPGH